MPEKKRIEYIDLAKGICILLVLMLHVTPDLFEGLEFLSCLRMPLYFCLSGLFFKDYGEFKKFLIKKSDRLLIPFVAWYLISYTIYYIRVFAIGEPETTFHPTDLFFKNDFYNGPIWFLLSLFWCNLIFYIINKNTKGSISQLILTIIVGLTGVIWGKLELHNFLYLGTSLTNFPFFFIGRQMMSTNFLTKENTKLRDLLIVLGLGAICFLIIYLPDEPTFMMFYLNRMRTGNIVNFYILSFSLVTIALLVCKYIKKIPFISFIGRFSIIVLVTHLLLHNILNRLIRHVTGFEDESLQLELILLGVVTISMLIIIPLCRKFLPYITAQKGFLEERFDNKKNKTVSSIT